MNIRSFSSVSLLTAVVWIGTPLLAVNVIHVPGDQPTIQAGINAAVNGDTVLVAPGTYYENIDFYGKAITVKSVSGRKVTIIDGQQVNSVVSFRTGESNASVLNGFTIQNGTASEGGGITVQGSSPLIINNLITNNGGCDGLGIGVGFGSPVIRDNIISNNVRHTCLGGLGGGGIGIRGASSAQIIGNTISNNTGDYDGGGIALWAANAVLIQNNIITGNVATSGGGGGISMYNDTSGVVIVQNLIKGNRAPTGNGIFWSNAPSVLVNNTITDSPLSSGGSTVWASGFAFLVTIENNIIQATGGAINAFTCAYVDFPTNAFVANDVFSTKGAAYNGLCTDQTGKNGNISANPLFVGSSNFMLKAGSPAIDRGRNAAPFLPTKDVANKPRVVNGIGGTTAIVDMGAYEFIPVGLTPMSLSYGLHTVGSSTSKAVKLTNNLNRTVNISSYSAPTAYSVSGCGAAVPALTSCTLTVTFHPLTSGKFNGLLIVNDDAGNSPQTVGLAGRAQ